MWTSQRLIGGVLFRGGGAWRANTLARNGDLVQSIIVGKKKFPRVARTQWAQKQDRARAIPPDHTFLTSEKSFRGRSFAQVRQRARQGGGNLNGGGLYPLPMAKRVGGLGGRGRGGLRLPLPPKVFAFD